MKKSLIITEFAPPMNEGSPIMIKNLFQYFPKGSYCILMDTLKEGLRRVDKSYALSCSYYFFNLPLYQGRNRKIGIFFTLLEFFLLPFLVMKGIKVARKERIDNILAPTNNRGFFLSAYFVHKITKKPLYLLMFDLFEEVQLSRIKKYFYRWLERRMFKSATKVFATTENMKRYYQKKYNIDTEVILHPIDLPSNNEYLLNDRDGFNIVYTGSIYSAQYECIARLINTINSMPNLNLYIYTTPYQGEHIKGSIKLNRRVNISYADRKDIFRIQKNADILFLPYTFKYGYPLRLIIENQAPAKLVEYFISGTPILLHAPAYSFLCQYNKENGFALTVDEPSEEALSKGISQLLNNKELRKKCVQNAFLTARMHEAKIISEKLQRYFLN